MLPSVLVLQSLGDVRKTKLKVIGSVPLIWVGSLIARRTPPVGQFSSIGIDKKTLFMRRMFGWICHIDRVRGSHSIDRSYGPRRDSWRVRS